MAASKTTAKPNPGQFRKGQPSAGAERRTQVGGFGDSKIFGGKDNALEKDLTGCTVNGEPLPRECWQTFPYSLTDQGKAEAKKLQAELGRDLPSVSYTGRDRTDYSEIFDDDKKQARFRAALADDTEGLVLAKDPLAPLMERHTPVGHRGLFMSKRVIERQGMVRGVLEYEPVMVDDGKGGRVPVTCGGLILASVPIPKAERAERYYQAINRELEVKAVDKVQEQADRIMSDRNVRSQLRGRGVTDAAVGIEEESQEAGDRDLLAHVPLEHE